MQVIRSFVRETVEAYNQKDKDAICDLINVDSSSERVDQLSAALYDVSTTVSLLCYGNGIYLYIKNARFFLSPVTASHKRSNMNRRK